jgi:hypothetical protein
MQVEFKHFDMEEDDENYETHKSQMKNVKDEEQIQDHVLNIMLIFNL